MKSEFVIQETVTLEDRDKEDIYRQCIEWLKLKKADIYEENIPSYIRAKYKIRTVTPIDLIPSDQIDLVILNIYLSQEKTPFPEIFPDLPKIKVEVKIPNVQFSTMIRLHRYVRWYQVVEELWNYLGVELDNETLRRYYPERHLKNTVTVMRNLFLFNFLLVFVIVLMLFHLYFTNQMGELPLLAFLLLASAGVYIQKPNLKVAREMKKLLRELYPDR